MSYQLTSSQLKSFSQLYKQKSFNQQFSQKGQNGIGNIFIIRFNTFTSKDKKKDFNKIIYYNCNKNFYYTTIYIKAPNAKT